MICLATNAVIAVIIRRKPELRRRLESAIAADAPIGIPTIVLFELRHGIARSVRPRENAAILAAFLAQLAQSGLLLASRFVAAPESNQGVGCLCGPDLGCSGDLGYFRQAASQI
jgi:predicted nucleic acid-binding protein